MGHSAEPLSLECNKGRSARVLKAKMWLAISHPSKSVVGKPSIIQVQTRDFWVLFFLEVQCLWRNSVPQPCWLVAPEPRVLEGGVPSWFRLGCSPYMTSGGAIESPWSVVPHCLGLRPLSHCPGEAGGGGYWQPVTQQALDPEFPSAF